MTSEEVWAMLLEHERLLRRTVRAALPRHRRDELDEAYSDVVLNRAHDIMATFDVARGVLPITHLCANVRWYAAKWVHRRCYKYIPPPVDLSLHERHDSGDSVRSADVLAEVDLILGALPEDARLLLEWYVMKGFTLGEIAKHFDPPMTKAQVKTRYREALELARELVGADLKVSRTVTELIKELTKGEDW